MKDRQRAARGSDIRFWSQLLIPVECCGVALHNGLLWLLKCCAQRCGAQVFLGHRGAAESGGALRLVALAARNGDQVFESGVHGPHLLREVIALAAQLRLQ